MQPAIYARYSSDNQREASIRDQVRNCTDRCATENWQTPIIYQDHAISGSRADRPEFLKMLNEANAGLFDILLIDDLSRLSRDLVRSEATLRKLQFLGIRVIGVSDGYDSTQKGAKLQSGVRGILNEIFLDDLAEKTHRGLKGQALAGQSAGGRSYGYDSTPVFDGKDITGYLKVINEEEAEWVRYIFKRYADGTPPRQIADELNRQKVPSPRGSTWAHSAIYGDMKRGLGMLNNPLYIGQYVWNRSKWAKDPSTGKRKRLERPMEEWTIQDAQELRIIDQETWNAVKSRQKAQKDKTTALRRKNGPRSNSGRAKYLLSGLLKCGCCGGNYIIIGKDYYGCASNKDRGDSVCSNRLRVRKPIAEDILLKHIKDELLSDDAYKEFISQITQITKEMQPDTKLLEKELKQAEKETENIIKAIRAGIITPATKQALEDSEQKQKDLTKELTQAKQHQPISMIPKAKSAWKRLVSDIGNVEDVPRARQAVREILGEITLHPNEEGFLEAEMNQGPHLGALSSIAVVAGGRYVGYQTIRIPLIYRPASN